MASRGLNIAGARSHRRRSRATRRVVCDAPEPDSGKFLACLDVVCAPCLQERVSGEGGHVECALCSAKTTPQWRGPDLSKQLPDCPSLVYGRQSFSRGTRGGASADAEAAAAPAITLGGGEPEGSGARGTHRVCDICEDEDGQLERAHEADSVCETCNGLLLCTSHVVRHTQARRYRGHSVVKLSRGHHSDGYRWPCPRHPKDDVTKFCVSCVRGVCARCQAVGHRGHAVESIASAAVKYRTMTKEALLNAEEEALQFDKGKCSTRIKLTNMNHTASHIGTSRAQNASVAAPQGFVSGRHRWSVRVCDGADNGYSIAAGVTVLPRNGSYTEGGWFFDQRRAYFWWCHGTFRSKPDRSVLCDQCAAWRDGDVITFTLNCEGKSLELYLHRTGERRLAIGLQCDEPLHPAVNLYHPGQAVEFC